MTTATPANGMNMAQPAQIGTPKKSTKKSGPAPTGKLLLAIAVVGILLMQAVMIFLIINPQYYSESAMNQRILDEVSRLTPVNPNEAPIFAVVNDAEGLRAENEIQAQVYADAVDGDFVIGFSDKMVIFRRSENKIVYEGEAPGTIYERNNSAIIATVVTKAKEAQIIAGDSEEVPQASIITNVDQMRSEDATFYANAENGDVIAVFNQAGKIVLYRPDTEQIVNSGTITTVISQ